MAISIRNSLTPRDRTIKRSFDFIGAFFGLGLTWGIILITYILATIDTRGNGIFVQKRIGRDGKPFPKFRHGKHLMRRIGTKLALTLEGCVNSAKEIVQGFGQIS